MIKIKEEKKGKGNKTPYYKLVFNYMIGDANGNTKYDVEVSKDNPYLERFVTLVNKLKPEKGHWGVGLDNDCIESNVKQKNITRDDADFLIMLMHEGGWDENVPDENDDYAFEFFEGVRSETEYSFLVFECCDLYYIDEYGKKHNTVIV